jgi:hypothetical protein
MHRITSGEVTERIIDESQIHDFTFEVKKPGRPDACAATSRQTVRNHRLIVKYIKSLNNANIKIKAARGTLQCAELLHPLPQYISYLWL